MTQVQAIQQGSIEEPRDNGGKLQNIYRMEDRLYYENLELTKLKRELNQQKDIFSDELNKLRAEALVSEEQKRQAQRDLISLRDELKRNEILENVRKREIQQTVPRNIISHSSDRGDPIIDSNKYANLFYPKEPKNYSKIVGNALPPKRTIEQRNLLAEEYYKEQNEALEDDRAMKYYESLMSGKTEPDFHSPYNNYSRQYIPDILDSLRENSSYSFGDRSNYKFRIDPNTGNLKSEMKNGSIFNDLQPRDMKRPLFSDTDTIQRLDNLLATLN